jgi:hypothetical protein
MKPFVSPVTRFEACDTKAVARPPPLDAAQRLPPFAHSPELDTLAGAVLPVARSWTKMSADRFASPATRFEASDVKATKRPSALIAGP